nr:reverse transcriptase domain-containing protein [Tanacetum cinerariifolium]
MRCEMDAIAVEDHTYRQSVMTNPCDDLKKKKPTTPMEDIEETTTSGKTYDLPVNREAKTTIIQDDSEDEIDEAEVEVEPSFSKQAKSDPPTLKAYKPKIPYPQCLRKEKTEECYAKFINLIKEVRINVPLVDVLVGMPNYGKFLKDLVSYKSKMEKIVAAFLNEECSTIVQNKLPSKLGDPRSFLILCTLANLVECLALVDLGASISLIPYLFYVSLFENTLKYTRMSILLANHTYQYLMGVAENILIQVGKFVFSVDFVILQMEEDDKVPLILGRSFLHTVDVIIRVKNKELNLRVEDDRITFLIDKAMQHSHSNDDTCLRLDVIDEVTEEVLDALLDNSEPFSYTSEKSTNHLLTKNSKSSWLSIIKTSIQDPPTDLEMKPLPKHLEYAFLEKDSLLPVVKYTIFKDDEKKRLVSFLNKHREAFA